MKNLKMVNLTPHKIDFINDDKEIIRTIESSGSRRVNMNDEKVDSIDNINIYTKNFGEVQGLPEQKEDTIYIVSRIVLNRVKDSRTDVYAPRATIRETNNKGQSIIIGCTGLSR